MHVLFADNILVLAEVLSRSDLFVVAVVKSSSDDTQDEVWYGQEMTTTVLVRG